MKKGDNMKRFSMMDEPFICENCKEKVEPLHYSARDHCPNCLYSKHVDILPGDRSNPCQGLLIPIGISKYKDTYKIVYQCEKCHQLHRNIMANDDNMDKIIELSTKQ